MIDWKLARRIARSLSGEEPGLSFAGTDLGPLARDAGERVVAYTRLEPRSALPEPELVSRHGWIDANLETMRPVFDDLEERLPNTGLAAGPLGPLARNASSAVLSAQLGAMTGYLAQRVLGQYELPLLDPDGTPRLLLVVPNLVATAERLRADRDDLLRWVTLHEVAHAVQFGSVDWLRAFLADGLRGLLDSLELRLAAPPSMRMPSPSDLRELIDSARSGELITFVIGRERRALVDRLQNTMAVVEGHAEHTMDVVGKDIIPSLAQLRAGLEQRRASRSTPLRLIERLLGIELKMRQYREGKRFCDIVVTRGGIAALNGVWAGERALPSQAELQDPGLWLERTAPRSAAFRTSR
jgi:coenzyme F420 biosynthesis associated uncharacterized protein